jgi:uncharacterized protein (DUF433 family)
VVSGAAVAPAHCRGVVEIDPRKGRGQPVRIAFAADLAIGDDVDAGALHIADREPSRIVLGTFELGPPPYSQRRSALSLLSTARKASLFAMDRITFNPNQCGGRPCIRGMRIRVKDVLDLLAAGVSEAEILADFPYLESEDIRACLAFAATEADHPVLVAADR